MPLPAIETLTLEQKIVLVAQKEGWQEIEPGYEHSPDMDARRPSGRRNGQGRRPVLDYLGSLDAIHAAVIARAQTDRRWYMEYNIHLQGALARHNSTDHCLLGLHASEAPAPLRVDAYLLASGLAQ